MNRIKIILGILLSIFFLYLALHKVNWQDVKISFVQANYIFIIPVSLLTVFNIWIRAYRWKYLISPIKNIPIRCLFAAVSIGFMTNALMPARLGDLARAYVLGEKEKLNKISSFGTVVLERTIDIFSYLVLFSLITFFFPFPVWVIKIISVIFAVGIIIVIILLILRRFSFFYPFTVGLKALRLPKTVFKISLLSAVLLFSCALGIKFTSISFGLNLSFVASFVIFLILAIGFMIPSAPAFIGTYQFFIVIGLGLFGVTKSQALSFSIVLQIAQYIPIIAMGFFFLWYYGFSLSQISQQLDKYKEKYKNYEQGENDKGN